MSVQRYEYYKHDREPTPKKWPKYQTFCFQHIWNFSNEFKTSDQVMQS